MANQLEERELLLAATQRQVEQRFELLASEILTEKSSLINHQHESTLKLLLSPFHKQLQEFQHKVDDVYDRETRDRVAITTEIQHLRQLNERLSNDAVNLTEALQGKNKLQGQWGEMVLEKILEESGLRKGVEYTTQVSLHTESGSKRQPDVIVHLPGKRDVIIDAKVSLKAFTQAHSENDEKRRRKYELRHLDSVKRHVTSLSSKQYHQLKGVSSMDFVLLFIPIETAFQKTLENDPEILSRSMRKQVVLCSPSTLLAILRTIQHLWRLDEQNRNGLIIAKQAGNLYDKFVGFIETFEEIGTRLHQSQQAWHLAKKRLSSGNGNLIKRAEYLKELGVQTDRELTEALKQTTRSQGEIS
nr:DNA recombination protein RmuC [Desulfogranum marinum]